MKRMTWGLGVQLSGRIVSIDKALGSTPRKLRHKGQSIGGKKENLKERKVDRLGGCGTRL